MVDARYDEHADWYAEYVRGAAVAFTRATAGALAEMLGLGPGRCVDIGCGTGVQAPVLRGLGWSVLGLDLSLGQLRHARAAMPVVAGCSTALPMPSGVVDAAVATLIHTDVADWRGSVLEAARVLRPGGRFAYVGVHPCFVGPFAERVGDTVRLHPGYHDDSLSFRGPGLRAGIRLKVGVRHRTLTDLIAPVTEAGLHLVRVAEFGEGDLPGLLGLSAVRP